MDWQVYKDAERMLEKEIREIVDKGELSPSTLEVMGKAVDDLKDISIICAMKREEEDGYSERRPYYYDDDMSYARRRRDSMGRYSRDYDGYSRDNDEHYEKMMREAKTDKERDLIRQLMEVKHNN